MKAAVLLVIIGDVHGSEYSEESARRYCELHGYDLLVRRGALDAGASPRWNKFLWLAEELPHYDAILQLDADAMIVGRQQLEAWPDGDIVSSGEMFPTLGNTLFRNTPALRAFLERMIDSEASGPDTVDSAAFRRALCGEHGLDIRLHARHVFRAFWFRAFGRTGTNVVDGETFIIHWSGGLKRGTHSGFINDMQIQLKTVSGFALFNCKCGQPVDSPGADCDSCKFAEEPEEQEKPYVVSQRTETVEVATKTESRDTGEVDAEENPIFADYYITTSRDDVYDVYSDGTEVLVTTGVEYVSSEGWV